MKTISLLFIACLGMTAWSQSPTDSQVYESEGQKFQVETLTRRGDVVWGFDFLADGRIVFTERAGPVGVLDIKTKSVKMLTGAPKVWARGQGGMMDVRVHPDSQKIFLTYSEPVGEGATTSLVSARLSGQQLIQVKKIFAAREANSSVIQFGSRIEFDKTGHIFVSIGDRDQRERVQDLAYDIGKVVRINEDGTAPKDNPFVNRPGARPEIWSYGHRSPEGFATHPVTGELWLAEMGPKGGDEINIIKPGANYGWPDVTYGVEYSGEPIGPSSKPGTEQPVEHWVPSISPSAIAFYSGDVFPKWKGNAFLANLSGMHLRRLVITGNKVTKQEPLLKNLNLRFRNVRTGPEGYLYISTDDGRIARLVPRK